MFRQLANGRFEIEVEGENHCGPDHSSPKRFDYEVEIWWAPGALDDKGFLLDNQSFERYFMQLGRTSRSCELLAQQACEHFRRLTGGKAVSIRVAIWGIPGAAKVEYQDAPEDYQAAPQPDSVWMTH